MYNILAVQGTLLIFNNPLGSCSSQGKGKVEDFCGPTGTLWRDSPGVRSILGVWFFAEAKACTSMLCKETRKETKEASHGRGNSQDLQRHHSTISPAGRWLLHWLHGECRLLNWYLSTFSSVFCLAFYGSPKQGMYVPGVRFPPSPPWSWSPLPLWCGVRWFGFGLSWWMLTKVLAMNLTKGKRHVMECPLPLWCGGGGLASASVGEAVVVVSSK